MKLISFQVSGSNAYGALTDQGIIDLSREFSDRYPDLKSALGQEAQNEFQQYIRQACVDYAENEVTFLPVIPNPDKVLCIGHNYEAHRLETNRAKTDYPSVFMRYAESQTAHLQPMIKPYESDMLDYEGEIAVVIGKQGRRIKPENAWEHVAGMSCYNDGSVRDWQWHTQQFGPGKNFEGTGSFGPYLLTAEELDPSEILSITTRLNGQVMQQGDTSMMLFPIPELIAYCSTFIRLNPGDVIVTGTPSGVGAKRQPPVFLKEGDEVEIEVTRLGVLRNSVQQG
ncbi:2-keto-4-pentenoate hydratase/2-oxohepta-3-ene-1,7-dioic acid hydratase in catechol pathway [Acinetobacter baylyi]|uniref:2-keto-4-pentenoate hydratase/2-oxohepta-3-ene-1,7-dioic acid hydratase in catechol pathway n=1 Tax=Acinetobacter baylyi TaxID=202950 RepID=A0ABU0UXR1_ACIBI|nr:fumarylacetoacetate hydrolase family protein [Acinetobacter baylyi]MDQ1209337.1 2-keto-4-pentenoate hydratase/2-oxohepta-3-ene-1,7-dioic acid hydratase in catechol pathway [Acinetobacter baylyi]MDR6107070.1 2-keto-4-pentenoate hydratase/2-oxohepta-3-ene-1,7-dioic acid hydratase in catechol pathway [Acinetobacter baylyi]MDR6186209.1 2-keto-4-pentenoate hydratase/2-oxohepta-3-ene-1,7-dioic acid hydratase in catechol pathway [Acinetobacter baylyi]